MNHEDIKILSALCLKYDKTIHPPIWPGGTLHWKKSKIDLGGVWYSENLYCLGNRLVYWHYGVDSKSLLRGSTSDNWGGYSFGIDFMKAIDWLRQSKFQDLEYVLWSGITQ